MPAFKLLSVADFPPTAARQPPGALKQGAATRAPAHPRTARTGAKSPPRLDFADTARFLILAVMLLAAAASAFHSAPLTGIAIFAAPFAAPACFALAGVFLHRSVDAPWPVFLRRKPLPLIYRAALLAAAAGAVHALARGWPGPAALARTLGAALLDPPAMLALVLELAVCLIAARMLRGLRAALVLPVLAALEVSHTNLGGPILSGACGLLVYLYAGHIFAPEVRKLARYAVDHRGNAAIFLSVWCLMNALAVTASTPLAGAAGVAALPFASLGLGLTGAAAVIALAALLDYFADAAAIRWTGARALHVWLAGFVALEAWRSFSQGAGASIAAAMCFLGAGALLLAFAMARRAAPQ